MEGCFLWKNFKTFVILLTNQGNYFPIIIPTGECSMNESILLGLPDHRKLTGIVSAMKARRALIEPHLVKLEGELKTAEVVGEQEVPGNVVSIGATVLFEDLASGEKSRVRLVFPAELDGTEGTISVLSPLGCAMIGERVGSSLSFQTPSGERLVKITMVSPE